ncbi:anthrone oxygenase family protein [Sulfitobacter sp. HNIBRBA3233]|uniref:anthrone oxygenase family protein n=1 Tax=Sulfitobacter marinivivus TaxID=3158558 RepID=UPI0032DE7F58
MHRTAQALILLSLLLSAAIFGFFYAWVCSTMWGLDNADPRVAIAAMQAMNASVRNAVFAPAFFATPVVLALTAALLRKQGFTPSAVLFALGATVYLCFGLILTMLVNVPMNEALAMQPVPATAEAAESIWQGYSTRWQLWNQIRTVASGVSFLLTTCGLLALPRTAPAAA